MRGPLASCLLVLTAACGSPSSAPLPAGSASALPPVPPAARASTAPREPLPVSTWPPRTPTGAAPETLDLPIADLHVDPRAAVSRDPFDTGSLPLDERVLEVSDEVFRAHWGVMHTTVEVRRADLPERRRALLFLPREGHPARGAPFLVIADAQHRVLWQKARPLAGVEARWRHLTVTAGPRGSVVVFGWDEASGAITGREFRHDGHLVGDRRVFDVADCAGLDAVWWPGRGWIVTTVAGGAAKTALLGEDGRRRFGNAVLDLGGAREVHPNPRIGAGVDGVFFAFAARARSAPGATPAPWRLIVTFRREDGTAPWRRDLDLGPMEVELPPRGGPLEMLDALNDAADVTRDSRPGMMLVALRLALRTPAVAEITGLERHLVGSNGSLDPDVGDWPP